MSNVKFKGKTAILNKFSKNFKSVRKSMKMDQEEFARFLKLSKISVSNYENKRRAINRDTLVRICDSLDDEMICKLFEGM